MAVLLICSWLLRMLMLQLLLQHMHVAAVFAKIALQSSETSSAASRLCYSTKTHTCSNAMVMTADRVSSFFKAEELVDSAIKFADFSHTGG